MKTFLFWFSFSALLAVAAALVVSFLLWNFNWSGFEFRLIFLAGILGGIVGSISEKG